MRSGGRSAGWGLATGLMLLGLVGPGRAAEPDGPVRPVPVTDDVIVDRPLSAEAAAAALAANHRVPGAVSELNVKRLRARLELAEIRIALCKNPDYELSLLDEMQWNIDQLTDQLIDLRHQVETGGSGDIGKPK